jgi:hypothetical protein
VGTLLRVAGGLLFLGTIFLPSLNGCGRHLSEAGLAADDASAGALGLMVVALAFGFSAFLGPLLSKEPRSTGEGLVAVLAAGIGAAALLFFDFARAKGARLLWAAQAQIVALAAILLGALLRFRDSRKPRR